jgi:hypothetical protein
VHAEVLKKIDQKVLDSAGVVREATLRQLGRPMSNDKAEVFALGLEFPPCLFGHGNVDEQPITHQA